MRAPIAYRSRRATTPPNIVPRTPVGGPAPVGHRVPTLSPEDYAGRIFPTGRGGTVTVEEDGTGTVRDQDGRYRTTLPAHTVAQLTK